MYYVVCIMLYVLCLLNIYNLYIYIYIYITSVLYRNVQNCKNLPRESKWYRLECFNKEVENQ